MPLTLTYDIQTADTNKQNYVRSALERFGWRRLGGSVFRYGADFLELAEEDWLNHVIPSLMFFRCYLKKNSITLTKFTIDTHGASFFDASDVNSVLGRGIQTGTELDLRTPTNPQSGVKALKDFVDGCTSAAP
jgi:hypothetical protein